MDSMEELKELAKSSGVFVVDTIIQRPQEISPATLMGEGKLKELIVRCMQQGVDLIIFDQNLSPGQMASISDRTELRVLDRTQLILDIFAQRAHTVEGKVQVELAQLKYLLPRLSKKDLGSLQANRRDRGKGTRRDETGDRSSKGQRPDLPPGQRDQAVEAEARAEKGPTTKDRDPTLSIIGIHQRREVNPF